jgi:hypothetical protein
MPEPRGHHFVAQLYQRGFARRSGKAWYVRVANRKTGEISLRNIENAFKQRDWNSIKLEDGELDFAIEKLFSDHIDGPAAPAIAALRDGQFPLGNDPEGALANFMAAQLTRGRMVRENLAQFVEQTTRSTLSLVAQNYTDAHWRRLLGEVPSADAVVALADPEKPVNIRPTNALLLDALLSSVDEMAELLSRRTWTLVTFNEPYLFTGEHPVVHVTGARGGYGVVTAEQFHFSVSPTRTLLLSHPWTSWPEGRVRGTRELAIRLNWATFRHPANNELLTHPDLAAHPLPSIEVLHSGGLDWPWPEDGDDAELEKLFASQRAGP